MTADSFEPPSGPDPISEPSFNSSITVQDDILEDIRDFLHGSYGIYFPTEKLYILKSKLAKRARNCNFESLADYNKYLKNNKAEIPRLLDLISTNKTDFYRETQHWKFLRQEILSELDQDSHFKAWSAACSSGEEPYTLALELERWHRRNQAPADYGILGSDISGEVLKTAMRGEYPPEVVQPVKERDPNLLVQFFRSTDGGQRIDPDLRQKVIFRQFNLREEEYPVRNEMDLVLCRNVLIYFDPEMIEHVVEVATTALKPEGYLFIGHTENLNEINHSLTQIRPSVFQLK